MNKTSKLLVATAGFLAGLTVVGQTTGVLAAWGESVWGNGSFGVADVQASGFARSSSMSYTGTTGTTTASSAERTHTNPGDSGTVPGTISVTSATFDGVGAGWSRAVFTQAQGASASSQATSLIMDYGTLPTRRPVSLNSPISNSVACPLNGAPTAVSPTGGPITLLGGTTLSIPADPVIVAPATSATTTSTATGGVFGQYVRATLRNIKTRTTSGVSSQLILDAAGGVSQPAVLWSNSTVLVKSECGLDGYIPANSQSRSLLDVVRDALTADDEPDDPEESAPPEVSASPDSSTKSSTPESVDGSTSASSATASTSSPSDSSSPPGTSSSPSSVTSTSSPSSAEPGSASSSMSTSPPTGPVAVGIGQPFTVQATDGTRLATARIDNVESTAATADDAPTVSIEMTITTSDNSDEKRLAHIAVRDFSPAVASTTERTPSLPTTLQPGHTYTGWITVIVPVGTHTVTWQPTDTPGYLVSLPTPTLTTPSTSTPPSPSEHTSVPVAPAPAPAPAPATSSPQPPTTGGPEPSDPGPTPEQPQTAPTSPQPSP